MVRTTLKPVESEAAFDLQAQDENALPVLALMKQPDHEAAPKTNQNGVD